MDTMQTSPVIAGILSDYKLPNTNSNDIVASLQDSKVLESSIANIESTIAAIKVQVHQLIVEDYESFIKDFGFSQDLLSNLEALFSEISTISKHVQSNISPDLFQALEQHKRTSQLRNETALNIEALEHLSSISEILEKFQTSLSDGKMSDAASCLQLLEYNIVTSPISNSALIMKSLTGKVAESKEILSRKLDDIISEAINITSEPYSMTVSRNVSASRIEIDFDSIFQALLELNSLDKHLHSLSKRIIKNIIDPFLSDYMFYSHVIKSSRFELIEEDSNPDVFGTLSALFEFIGQTIFSSKSSSYRSEFGKLISHDLAKAIEERYLVPLTPIEVSDLSSFDDVASSAKRFEQSLQESGFLPYSQSEGGFLSSFIDILDVHFVAKRRDAVLRQARNWMISEKFEQRTAIEEVVVVVEPEEVQKGPENLQEDNEQPRAQTPNQVLTPPPTLSPTSPSVARALPRTLSPAPEVDDIDVDAGWGFDEGKAEAEESKKDADEEVEEDGWGFGEKEEGDTEQEDNGWEWGKDEQSTEESNTENVSKISAPTSASVPPPAVPDWSWGDDDEDETGWSEEKKHAKRMSRQFAQSNIPKSIPEPHPEPAPPVIITQQYTISASCEKCISLVRKILSDAKDITSMHFENSHLAFSSGRLLTLTRELFDLYRAVMPSQHGESLKVPALGMQFYNDCNYLVKELQKIEKEYNGVSFLSRDGQSQIVVEYPETIRRLSHLGHRYYQLQLEAQEETILEILEQAANFVDVADEIKFARCQSAIEAIKLSIRQIAKMLKSILTPTMFSQTMGTLIETIVLRITDDIEDLIDIGETESQKLGELCRMLYDLDDIFIEGDPEQGEKHTAIVLHVPHWLKFNYLAEVLEASMADIMYLFRQGALVDFTTTELEQLICALFADTPLREKNLTEIRAGPKSST